MSTHPTTITAPPGTPFIEVVRDFDATPAQLFRAATDPALVARWLGPREIGMEVLEYDVRPGGRYRYVHRSDGTEHGFRGVFHTVEPDRLVIQTFEWEGAPGEVSLESATYEDLGDRTRLRTWSVFKSVASRDAAVASGMEHGIRDSMDRLAELTAEESPEGAPDGCPAEPVGRVVVDITMSLDGYVTAPGADLEHGLGVDGEVLHTWVSDATPADSRFLEAPYEQTGAVIMGRRLFDFVDGPHGWDETMGYGARAEGPAAPPVFVVTHSVPDQVRLGPRFHFVTDGPESALDQARAVAGGKDVVVMGGGDVCHQFLRTGLADTLVLHVAPVILGGGTPLFPADGSAPVQLELLDSVSTPGAQHLTYRVGSGE